MCDLSMCTIFPGGSNFQTDPLRKIAAKVLVGRRISKNPVMDKQNFSTCKPKCLKYRQIDRCQLQY